MNNMFQDALAFNQDLSGWEISPNLSPKPPSDFSSGASSQFVPPQWYPPVILDSNNVTYKFVGSEPTGSENPFFVTSRRVVYAVMRSSQDEDADSIAKINAYATNQTTGGGPFTHSTAGVIPFERIVTTNMRNMNSLFSNAATFNGDITSWDVSNVTNVRVMFYNATSFNRNIGAWNVSKVVIMSNMFNNAWAFNQNIGGWNVSSVTNMDTMFNGATAFNNNNSESIGAWDVSKVTNMSFMFEYAAAFNQNIGAWNVSRVVTMQNMFYNAGAFNQNIGAWNVSSVLTMESMFNRATTFNNNNSESIGAWNVSSVFGMSNMFQNAAAFNQNIGGWNVLVVNNMNNMFNGAIAFNQDLSGWIISPNLSPKPPTDFSTGVVGSDFVSPIWTPVFLAENGITYKFIGTIPEDASNPYIVKGYDDQFYAVMKNTGQYTYDNENDSIYILNNYGFGNNGRFMHDGQPIPFERVVTTEMRSFQALFFYNSEFNKDVTTWDSSNVTTLENAFQVNIDSGGLFNQNIRYWNTSNVTNMNNFLRNQGNFNQDISNWNVDNVTTFDSFADHLAYNKKPPRTRADPNLNNFQNIRKNLNDSPFDVIAPNTYSSGQFTYTSSNLEVATISGNTITIVGVGQATIIAAQSHDTIYRAASINATLTVET
jgi:surface protein